MGRTGFEASDSAGAAASATGGAAGGATGSDGFSKAGPAEAAGFGASSTRGAGAVSGVVSTSSYVRGRFAERWLLPNRTRRRSATSTSTELECVFFSVTPKSGNNSIKAFEGISSSRANSLIRIMQSDRGNRVGASWASPSGKSRFPSKPLFNQCFLQLATGVSLSAAALFIVSDSLEASAAGGSGSAAGGSAANPSDSGASGAGASGSAEAASYCP